VNYPSLGTCSNGVCYNQGVRLSPDESLIYTSLDVTGQLTGAFFDKSTGVIGSSCTSGVFKNFGNPYFFASNLATKRTPGTGSPVYVAESGGGPGANAVAIIDVTSSNGACTLTEDSSSPALDNNATGFMLSLTANPARKY
jgi:hypothetical protein